MTTRQRPRGRLARRVAFGYLAVVTAVSVVVVALVVAAGDDPFVLAPLTLVTAPTSLLLLPSVTVLAGTPGEPWRLLVGFACYAAAALFQAWLLWMLVRGRRPVSPAGRA